MRVAIIGLGYVGSTVAAWLGSRGHLVVGVESDEERLKALRDGRAPVSEPGLDAKLGPLLADGRVRIVDRYDSLDTIPDAVVVAVNTPAEPSGKADLSHVRLAFSDIRSRSLPKAVVLRSTVPPGTSRVLMVDYPAFRERYAYVPDFLRQGHAFEDLDAPARVVIGAFSASPPPEVDELFRIDDCVNLVTDPTSAELVKYASNGFLAAKISFANEIADLCEAVGANADDVLNGVGADRRIGRAFLQAGLGYGDSCLPKDTRGYRYWADSVGARSDIVEAAMRINERQRTRMIHSLRKVADDTQLTRFGKIAVLGVRYLTSSSDLRGAPSRWVVPQLREVADDVSVWDQATDRGELIEMFPGVSVAATVNEALDGAGLSVVLGRWPDLRRLDWSAVAQHLVAPRAVLDPTNFLVPSAVTSAGLRYYGYGRA